MQHCNRVRRIVLIGFAATTFGLSALASAQEAPVNQDLQRNVDQQQRIEHGLRDGQLSTREASQLEQGQTHVDRMEQRDLSRGPLTGQEQTQIQHAENVQSRDIYRDDHNNRYGNPYSASSRRMQADVRRDANQQRRIDNGVRNGSLNNAQTSRLEGREARVDHMERRAGANGYVGRGEQRRVQQAENRDSRAIHRNKRQGR